MAETLSARVGRIVSSSAHAFVDAVEEAMPDAVGRQNLREIDRALDEVRGELGLAIACKHLAVKRLNEQSSRHESLSGQIDLALAQDREDLAQAAVERQLDVEDQTPVLEATIGDAAQRVLQLEAYVAALQAKRREMMQTCQDLEALRREHRTGQAASGLASRAGAKSIDPHPAANKASMSNDLTSQMDSRLAELDALERSVRVSARLRAAKAAVKREL